MLDKQRGVVSPPESSFPQVLGVATPEERADPRRLAALYLGATFPPTPLSLDDAEACMEGSDEEILVALGKAVAVKLGRNPDEVKAIVWKTPRTVGMHTAPLATSGKFIVLRRHPQNVFESQFRVEFGENNRNPFRFAVFRESYEHAFARLPRERVFELGYDDLPGVIPRVLEFIGVENAGLWDGHRSSLEMASEACSWMSEVTREFENRDPEKRARLDPKQVSRLELAMKLARPMRPFLGPVRAHFDQASMGPIRERAARRFAEGQ
ncbi:hypothetical protein HAHE_22300 [Haloferula helveola]|uniref:Sulfotransferase family protein n=2 Tax=Haloferula helveola TaxID=490095 RepID=A0ABM7RF27_9BACT|nr:hypothetical protein HAHE_22300 [Haloferula helveola]